MTPEQLDEIEKLAEAQEFLRAGSYALPMIKALRESRAALEWQGAMTKALSESQERLVQEVKESRAEVEQLRERLKSVATALQVFAVQGMNEAERAAASPYLKMVSNLAVEGYLKSDLG